MFVCTLGGEGGRGLKKCTVCTLTKMLTFLELIGFNIIVFNIT